MFGFWEWSMGVAGGGIAVRDVVRAVVETEAPEERAIVGETSGLEDGAAMRRLTKRSRGRTLGFGTAEAVALVASVVWMTVGQAARELGAGAGRGADSRLRALMRRLRRRQAEPVRIPPLSPAQVEMVRNRVYEAMKAAKFGERRAVAVADRVFRELSIPPSAPHRPTGTAVAPQAGSRDEP
jgi:hypothetical protein